MIHLCCCSILIPILMFCLSSQWSVWNDKLQCVLVKSGCGLFLLLPVDSLKCIQVACHLDFVQDSYRCMFSLRFAKTNNTFYNCPPKKLYSMKIKMKCENLKQKIWKWCQVTYKPVLFQKMILKVPWFFFLQNCAWVLTNSTNSERINICN